MKTPLTFFIDKKKPNWVHIHGAQGCLCNSKTGNEIHLGDAEVLNIKLCADCWERLASMNGLETVEAFRPELSVLIKLGSIAVHAQEMIEPGGHSFDVEAIKSLFLDPQLNEWLASMDKMAFLPVKRSAPPRTGKGKKK